MEEQNPLTGSLLFCGLLFIRSLELEIVQNCVNPNLKS